MVENLILIVMITSVQEEEVLIAAHRKEIEDTMETVREKAAGLVSLQARLARFQHRLKEQEILSRKRVPPR
ncbi:hypothetical protein YC2023_012371 [Brassica napus]